MKESSLMFMQYATGVLILILGAMHFLLISTLAPTADKVLYHYASSGGTHSLISGTLYYYTVKAVYSSVLWGAVFELLLVFLVYHIFNGFRVILSEQFNSAKSGIAITYTLLVIALIILIYGSRTIILMLSGGGL